MFCGQPGEGIHNTRVLGFAFWDIVITVVAALLIKRFVFRKTNFLLILLGLVATGIVVHKALGIDTKLNHMIFNIC